MVHVWPPGECGPMIWGVNVNVPALTGVPLPVNNTNWVPVETKLPWQVKINPFIVSVLIEKFPVSVTFTLTAIVLIPVKAIPALYIPVIA